MNSEITTQYKELEWRREEKLEQTAQAFQAIGWIFLGLASIFAGFATLSRLQRSQE